MLRRFGRPALLGALTLLLTTGAQGPAGCSAAIPPIEARLVVGGLEEPMLAGAPKGDPRLFVLERKGRIRIVEAGALRAQPFLDLSTVTEREGEGGLLGIAFAPDYETSGRFYVYSTRCIVGASSGGLCNAPGGGTGRLRAVLSRFTVSADPNVALAGSEQVLLDVGRPDFNHVGGSIAFRPTDGQLYLGFGDGGGQDDPQERAQNPAQLLGKMVRIDVSGSGGYTVPPSNPFVGVAGALPEIWSLGFRNPYRWSIDRQTGDLWIADVGQSAIEEVNRETAATPGGRNYGWDVMEGDTCHTTDPAPSPPCRSPSLTLPVHQYGHTQIEGVRRCAIVGGPVYRGVIPELRGLYLYADYCTGEIFALDPAAPTVATNLVGSPSNPGPLRPIRRLYELSSLSEDGHGELYVTFLGTQGLADGELWRIHSTLPDQDADGAPDHGDNCTLVPNGPLVPDAGGNVQLDADGDGNGNLCDADIDQNGIVNFGDVARFKQRFLQPGGAEDFDGNGVVAFADLLRLRNSIYQAPGPSGVVPIP